MISVSPSGPARRPAGLDLGLGRGLRPSLRDGPNGVPFGTEKRVLPMGFLLLVTFWCQHHTQLCWVWGSYFLRSSLERRSLRRKTFNQKPPPPPPYPNIGISGNKKYGIREVKESDPKPVKSVAALREGGGGGGGPPMAG